MVGVLSRGLLSLISMNSKLLFCGGLQNRTTKFYNMIRTLLLAVWLMFMLAPPALLWKKKKSRLPVLATASLSVQVYPIRQGTAILRCLGRCSVPL